MKRVADKKNKDTENFLKEIEKDAKKKIKAKDRKDENIFGLGYFGIIGWSIAIPTLLAIALGQYLDNRYKSNYSWTLALIFIGVISGCINAWRWLNSNK